MEATPIPGSSGGDPFVAIDADLTLLADLDTAEQLPVFGRIHTALTGALAATAADGAGSGR